MRSRRVCSMPTAAELQAKREANIAAKEAARAEKNEKIKADKAAGQVQRVRLAMRGMTCAAAAVPPAIPARARLLAG